MNKVPTQYHRIRVANLQNEIKMVSELRRIGQPFKAVSKTDYIVSDKQCKVLKSKKIPYEILS
jgi:hypothetical protein